MLEFITNHWQSIVVIIVFAVVIIYLMLRGKKDIVAKMLYALVTEAEKIYGSGTGSVKFAYVLGPSQLHKVIEATFEGKPLCVVKAVGYHGRIVAVAGIGDFASHFAYH